LFSLTTCSGRTVRQGPLNSSEVRSVVLSWRSGTIGMCAARRILALDLEQGCHRADDSSHVRPRLAAEADHSDQYRQTKGPTCEHGCGRPSGVGAALPPGGAIRCVSTSRSRTRYPPLKVMTRSRANQLDQSWWLEPAGARSCKLGPHLTTWPDIFESVRPSRAVQASCMTSLDVSLQRGATGGIGSISSPSHDGLAIRREWRHSRLRLNAGQGSP
jgi:hypothetical protein